MMVARRPETKTMGTPTGFLDHDRVAAPPRDAAARIADWNEIDAVGLIDKSGRLQWASRATASSTYAKDQPPAPEPQRTAELLRRVRRLEELARELRKELEEMKK